MSDQDSNQMEMQRWLDQRAWSFNKPIKSRWLELVRHFMPRALDSDPFHPAERWYERLRLEYEKPNRHYHNLSHITSILDCLPMAREQFATADEVLVYQLAAWFHDSVCDSRRGDNELHSAGLLQAAAGELHLPPDIVAMTSDWILATRDHNPAGAAAAAFCDADLAILGSPEPLYSDYKSAIRLEYDWVPDDEYRTGRSKVLRHFLERERIYMTRSFHDSLDAFARRNLSMELAELEHRK